MSQDPTHPSDTGPWTPRRRGRIAVGLLAGFGATGIAAGLALIGTFVDIDMAVGDFRGLILMAPVIIAPGFAGAVLRGRDAVAAITTGAVAGPIAAIFALDDSCSMTMWAALGLTAIAANVLFIAGIAAFVGAWIGRADTVEYQPRRGVVALAVVGTIGVFAWIAAVAIFNSCP